MLQMVTFLNNQNGSILDSLLLWRRNVDKRFEGKRHSSSSSTDMGAMQCDAGDMSTIAFLLNT